MQKITTQEPVEGWKSHGTSASSPIPGQLSANPIASSQTKGQEITDSKSIRLKQVHFVHLGLMFLFLLMATIWFYSQVSLPIAKRFADPSGNATIITLLAQPILIFLSAKSTNAFGLIIDRWLTLLIQRTKKV